MIFIHLYVKKNGSEKVKFIQKIVSYAWEKNNSSCVILINFHSLLKFIESLAWCPWEMEMVTGFIGTINIPESKVF